MSTPVLAGCCPTQVIIRRGQAIAGPAGPIIVATRNDALDAIVDATPVERRDGVCACAL